MQRDHHEPPLEIAGRLPLAIATAAFLAARIPLLGRRSLDPDELEHAHAAWSLFMGMLPYKDFFEHHTPWYYFVLRPFFHWFDVDGSFASAQHFLLLGRVLSLVLTVVSVLLVSSIGRLWQAKQAKQDEKDKQARSVGLVAALLLVSQPIFLQKTLEMRPDVLALAFFLGGLWFLLRGMEGGADATGWCPWRFAAAGLGLGAAIMCTQKMLFVLPGALAGLAMASLFAEAGTRPRTRILAFVVFVLGVCLPGALTWVVFAFHHAGREFITNNFLLNATWKHFATGQLLTLIVTSWPVLSLALLGAAVSLIGFSREGRRRSEGLVLLCIVVGLFLGVLVMPVPHRQYYLMPLPIVCLFAAQGLFVLGDRLRQRLRPRRFAMAGIVLTLSLAVSLAILPAIALRDAFRDRNEAQLAKLRQVFESTQPTDLVMDGWEGMGVFRPHAFHYFFLHEEAIAMLPPAKLAAYLDSLESGMIRPKLIAMDRNLWNLGPRFVRFVESRYTSTDGFFYFERRGH